MLNFTPVAGSVYVPGTGFEIWNCRTFIPAGVPPACVTQLKLLPPTGTMDGVMPCPDAGLTQLEASGVHPALPTPSAGTTIARAVATAAMSTTTHVAFR